MLTLTMQQEGDWVRLRGPSIRGFIEYLKFSVKPTSLRRYDSGTATWLIYNTMLRSVASVARRFYQRVDWSTLPDVWQMQIAGAELPAAEQPPAPSPYAVLHVLDDAPMEVVRAAYKVLAAIHHPDHNGSEETMARINTAYETICAKRGA